ncbi:MAG: FliG C-terminal domain-containing protein [Roseovarius confluentis]|uniref:flagellar motor switch protein FliG n=1 Tax=Roseovarius sp. TaxID=1486281 RepID=UPI0032EB3313
MPFDTDMPDLSLDAVSASAAPLTPKQKAAVVVRLLLSEGAVPALSSLPESKQTELAIQLARMAPVDQATVAAVAEEFANAIENIGLSFPAGLDGALGLLEGVISSSASNRLREMAPSAYRGDPWERVGAIESERLVKVLERESNEVAAVILSKLKVSKAAELLGLMPGERARRITYGVSLTGNVSPDVVFRIGVSLAEELEKRPARAFPDGPVMRVGAILNYAPGSVRDEILEGLEKDDAAFARDVRQAIFTFANIPERVSGRDIAKVQAKLDQADLITVVAGAEGADRKAVEYFLANISKRLAENIGQEATEKGTVKAQDTEAAMIRIVNVIRELEAEGEIFFVAGEE